MKYIKIVIIQGIIIISTHIAAAQSNKIYRKLASLIQVNEIFYTEKYYEKGFVFSVSIGVNSKGVVDTVIFSNYRKDELSELIDYKKIKDNLIKDKTNFVKHKNEILVLLVMVVSGDNWMPKITNGNQLLQNWTDIAKNTEKLEKKGRKQVFLVPFRITSLGNTKEF